MRAYFELMLVEQAEYCIHYSVNKFFPNSICKSFREKKSILDFSTKKLFPCWGKVLRGRHAPGLGKGRFGVSWIIERINEIYPALSHRGS